jgi:PAS domain S-box-containing protein
MGGSTTQGRNFLAGMLNACPVAMLGFDTMLRCIACNTAAERELGLRADRAIGRPMGDLLPMGDGARVEAVCRAALAGAEMEGLEAGLHRLRVSPVRGAGGAIVGGTVVVLAADEAAAGPGGGTDPKLARALLDALPNALLAFDTDLRIIEWNAQTARANRRPREEAVGRSLLDIFPYIRGSAIEGEYRRALRGETVDGRDRCWTPTGEERPRWFDVVYRPLHDQRGAVVGGLVATSDVTARREARNELTRERRTLRTVIDSAPFGLLAFDRELCITEWNAHAERTTGLRRADAVHRLLFDVLPDLRGSEVERDYMRALSGETVRVRGRWYQLPGGESRCYDAVFAPMHDGRGAVTGGVMIAIDMTDRARAEEADRAARTALAADRAFLRSLIDASPAPIVAFDRELRQTEWNERAERITGISRERALGRSVEELYPGFLGSEWHRLVSQALTGEVVRRFDFALADPSTGDLLSLDVTMAPLYDGEGAVAGAIVMALDVTERTRVQRQLAESERRYRQLFEQSAAMQIVYDAETLRVLDANAPAVAFYGYSRAELLDMTLDCLVEPGAARDGTIASRLREGEAHARLTHLVSSGERREVDSYSTALTRDGRRVIHAAMHDVTARVRAEAERDRLASIVEATSDIVTVFDASASTITYINRAGRELLGVRNEEVGIGTAPFVAAEDSERVFGEGLSTALREGVWRAEFRARSRAGRVFPISTVAIAHYDADGKPVCISSISRDVSLEREREAELAAAREEAERASRAKSAFLAGMSHELRTPLGAVIGFAQLVRDEHVGALSSLQREYLDDVLAGAEHLSVVVDGALDLARIEAGVIDIRPRPVDLGELVDEAFVTVAAEAAVRGVRLERRVAPAAARVVADPARLRQVLLNFLTNAIKFNRPNGQVRVLVTPESADAVRLSVRDTGRGIAAEDISRLFVEWQRLGIRDVPGTGLGLAITRRLVEAMGGTTSAESEPGVGSVFHAVLPRGRLTSGAAVRGEGS